MNFLKALTALCTLAAPAAGMVNTAKDQHHINRSFVGNSIWVFGSEGVNIFNPDGSANMKSIDKNDICHMVAGYRGPEMELSCSFYDVVSDGKKYVWAAVSRGVAKIDILDIDTGDVVGAFETCMSPRKMEYHPLREEIWVRCSEVESNATSPSYLDVFSTSSPSVAIETDMLLKENTELSSRGYSVIDNSLGDVGYVTDRDQPYLFKIDLSDKSIIDKFPLELAHGAYEVAYSRMNRHVFVRATVCCTCGFEGSDQLDCGRYGSYPVNVTTGAFAMSMNINGMCNRCDGLASDTLGVYEFNTATDTVIGSHLMKEGFGGDPFPSPDGKYIVLIGRNGGTTVRILQTGANDVKSTVFADLELGFNSTTNEDDQVFTDFAFIEKDGKSLFVIVSGTENRAAIVDFADINNPKFVTLTSGPSTARRLRRQVEWAVGTDYVWVDGTLQSEIYVIDVMKGELVNTIEGLYTTKLLSVQNYAKMYEAKMQQELIDQALAASMSARVSTESSMSESSSSSSSSSESLEMELIGMEARDNAAPKDDNDIDPVGVIGLIVGCCALIVGTANVFVMSAMKTQITTTTTDLVSLGSKDVA